MTFRSLSLFLVLTLWLPAFALAQAPAPAPKPTVVTSDTFWMDLSQQQGHFTGNVKVTGSDFEMTARELKVYFTPDNKIDRLTAQGDVIIVQPDRRTKSGQADYFLRENKIVLTNAPEVNDAGKIITGKEIRFYRASDRMEVEGGGGGARTRIVIPSDQGVDASAPVLGR